MGKYMNSHTAWYFANKAIKEFKKGNHLMCFSFSSKANKELDKEQFKGC
jgi:hypothetical protein